MHNFIEDEFRTNSDLYFVENSPDGEVFPVQQIPGSSVVDIEDDVIVRPDHDEMSRVAIQMTDPPYIIPVENVTLVLVGRDEWTVGPIVHNAHSGMALLGRLSPENGRQVFDEFLNGNKVGISLQDSDGTEFANRINAIEDQHVIREQREKIGTEVDLEDVSSRLYVERGEHIT